MKVILRQSAATPVIIIEIWQIVRQGRNETRIRKLSGPGSPDHGEEWKLPTKTISEIGCRGEIYDVDTMPEWASTWRTDEAIEAIPYSKLDLQANQEGLKGRNTNILDVDEFAYHPTKSKTVRQIWNKLPVHIRVGLLIGYQTDNPDTPPHENILEADSRLK